MKNNILSKIAIAGLLLLFNSAGLAAHNIVGRVSDASTGEVVTGATVFIPALNIGTTTDELGAFKIKGLDGMTYELTVSFIGFETRVVQATTSAALDIRLNPTALNLKEIVVNNQRDLSKTMTIINQIDLELRPTRSSQDVLRMVPGLFTAQHAGGGKAEQIYLRGFDIDHGTDIRVTVDGMPVNMVSHAHGQGYADLHFLIPELIDNVDFNKGPYYTQQGDFTTAGYANFNTRNALNRSSLKLETGRFDTYRAVGLIDLLHKSADSRQNAYFASDLTFTNGPFESPQNFNRINLMGKYNGLIGTDKVLTVSLSTFSSRWEASGQIPDRAVRRGIINRFGAIDDREGGNTSRTNANIQLLKTLENGDLLRNQFYYVNNQFRLYSNFTFFLEDPVNGDEIRQVESRDIFGSNTSYVAERAIGNMSLRSEAGLNIRYDKTRGSELAHTANRNRLINYLALGDIDQLNASLYLDEVLKVSDRFTVNAGLRFDQFSFGYVNQLDSVYAHPVVYANTFSPKLNFYYNASPNVQFYLKSGIGFHSNDTRVVVPQNGVEILPKAYGVDFGTFVKPFPRLFLNLAAWFLDLEQEFVYVGDAAVVEPSGKTRRYGLDFSGRYQATDWLFVDVDLNYTRPRSRGVAEGENYIPLAPTFTSIGGLTTKFGKGLNASLRYRHISDRPANENDSVTAQGYTLLDGGITYTARKCEFGLSFENILNVDWNEAQFDTESRLFDEPEAVSELHYTPGTPFFVKGSATFFF
ncbi:MAG: TonB-dependent receptor [Saprospiraceae bacterium]|nr:TonB-dependent receptor [Saprospiraceae bacterium]